METEVTKEEMEIFRTLNLLCAEYLANVNKSMMQVCRTYEAPSEVGISILAYNLQTMLHASQDVYPEETTAGVDAALEKQAARNRAKGASRA